MKFRPCIDIHNGKVKQIIGSSLKDEGDAAKENFVAGHDASWFADLFKRDHLTGGHVILLNSRTSPYYEATRAAAIAALETYPGGLQVGGGIRADNAEEMINAGASHIIVTSYVFYDGKISMEHLKELEDAVGKEHIVLDLSCSRKDGRFYIMTDRWQKYTDTPLDAELMQALASHCDEFLIHAIDVEGKEHGLDEELMDLLVNGVPENFPVTYAGGIRSFDDIEEIYRKGHGKIDFTIGSALDIYGGALSYQDVVHYCNNIELTE